LAFCSPIVLVENTIEDKKRTFNSNLKYFEKKENNYEKMKQNA